MLKRTLIFLHRWLGVALCLLFLIWFPSGIAMMYWDFPGITDEVRLLHAAPLRAADVRIAPAEAWATLREAGAPLRARLQLFDGRPLYRFQTDDGDEGVYADTGERRAHASADVSRRIAAAWTGQPADAATVETIDEPDQWTVQGSFRSLRPLWKYSWPSGDQVYISPTSGDVVQFTTTASRIGAYLGPIPHWFYLTPLRKHQARWSAVVIYTSGIGTVSALLGVIIAALVFSPSKRYRHAGRMSHIPYAGYKRWHMLLGLAAGAGAVTWAFSGMLSMDPLPVTPGGAAGEEARAAVQRALRGPLPLHAFDAQHPRDVLASVSSGPEIKELELLSVGGEPLYLATLRPDRTRVVPLDGRVANAIDEKKLGDIVANAAGTGVAELRVVTAYDRYYLDRRGTLPLPVLLVRLNDDRRTRYYIDPRTASVVGSYNSAEWSSRWLYHGLHSLDFPWLYSHPPAWDIVMLAFMLGGTALSVTSLVLAWRVVGRALQRSAG
jgi:PepSY-associated TM region